MGDHSGNGGALMSVLAILSAGFTGWAFGALYYGLVSKEWLSIAAISRDMRAMMAAPEEGAGLALFLSFAAQMVMAGILALILSQMPPPSALKGVLVGLMLWLGFVATSLGVSSAYRRGTLAETAIDALHWLGVLMLMGAILGMMA